MAASIIFDKREKAREDNTILEGSKVIDDFLKFLRDAKMDYAVNQDIETEAEKETQDILHTIELDDISYHEYARLSKALKTIRQRRRAAKDRCIRLEPVVTWCNSSEPLIKSLERLLGLVRKAEKSTENRMYVSRTKIVQDTLDKGGSTN